MGCAGHGHKGVSAGVFAALLLCGFFVSGLSHRLFKGDKVELLPPFAIGDQPANHSSSFGTASAAAPCAYHPQTDPNKASKRRVPNGPDPIHNRRAGKSRQPPGKA